MTIVNRIKLFCSLLLVSSVTTLCAQDDPLSLDDTPEPTHLIKEAFNGSYIINNQSSNVLEAGRLNFNILHRFGEFSEGSYSAFGLDYATIRLGLEYGVLDKLTLGLGRSSSGKNYDGYAKYRLITQSEGTRMIPISVVGFASAAISLAELKRQNLIQENGQFIHQLVYTSQLIISRQFSDVFSFEVIPAVVHRNSVPEEGMANNIYSLSAGGRIRISQRMHLIGDYSYVFNKDKAKQNPVAIGIDMVTGGHTFQLYLTNAIGFIEKEFLTATTGKISDGDIRIGFTVSRAFMLQHKVTGGQLK